MKVNDCHFDVSPVNNSDLILKACRQGVDGFLRRNLYACPQAVKEAAYKGLARLVMEYRQFYFGPLRPMPLR